MTLRSWQTRCVRPSLKVNNINYLRFEMARGKVTSKTPKDTSPVGQLKTFAKESQMFLTKCTKPDKKGMLLLLTSFRIHEDPPGLCHRIPRYGLHWLLRQARLHPYQQHHPWNCRIKRCLINVITFIAIHTSGSEN